MTRPHDDADVGIYTRDPMILAGALDAVAAAGGRAVLLDSPEMVHALSHSIIGADLLPDVTLIGGASARRLAVVGLASASPPGDLWAAAAKAGAEVVVAYPDIQARLVPWLADLTRAVDDGCPVVTITGGSGGSGASTLALALSVRHAYEGGTPTLVDLDPWGGGLDVLAGVEDESGLRWPDLVEATAVRRADLPTRGGVAILAHSTGHRPLAASNEWQLVSGLRQASTLVVADVPRLAIDAPTAVRRTASWSLLVVVSTVSAVAAAHRVISYDPIGFDGLVLRQVPGGTLAEADVVRLLGLPVLGVLRDDRQWTGAADRGDLAGGMPRSALARASAQLLGILSPGGR